MYVYRSLFRYFVLYFCVPFFSSLVICFVCSLFRYLFSLFVRVSFVRYLFISFVRSLFLGFFLTLMPSCFLYFAMSLVWFVSSFCLSYARYFVR